LCALDTVLAAVGFDLDLLVVDTKLTEYKIDEKEVSKILLQVAVARREAEIVRICSNIYIIPVVMYIIPVVIYILYL